MKSHHCSSERDSMCWMGSRRNGPMGRLLTRTRIKTMGQGIRAPERRGRRPFCQARIFASSTAEPVSRMRRNRWPKELQRRRMPREDPGMCSPQKSGSGHGGREGAKNLITHVRPPARLRAICGRTGGRTPEFTHRDGRRTYDRATRGAWPHGPGGLPELSTGRSARGLR
jgi:hypothetical protein